MAGRFLGRDPIGYEGSEWALYCFLKSKSLNSFDPTGLIQICDEILAATLRCLEKKYRHPYQRNQWREERAKAEKSWEECNERLGRLAVQQGVLMALKSLGLDDVNPGLGTIDKATLSDEDVQRILNSGHGFDEVVTISGAKAIRVLLDPPWELKIYQDENGNYSAAVGYRTGSLYHNMDALRWLLGNSPNAQNAETYGRFSTADDTAWEALRRARKGKCGPPSPFC
jgi:hypothetical protein